MFPILRAASAALALAAVLSATIPGAQAQTPAVTVQNPWARASAGNAANGAAYLTLTGTAANRLVSASSPVATTVELHEVVNDNGVMKMRAIRGIEIVPGKPTTLAPGGLHVMLLGLRQPLRQGESIPLTLTFAQGAPMTIQVPVQAVGAMGADPAHKH